jgi:hypothetical protein
MRTPRRENCIGDRSALTALPPTYPEKKCDPKKVK